jgi:hypothetical protein
VVDSATTLAEKLKTKLEKGKGQNRLHLYFTDKGAFLENLIRLIGLEEEMKHFEVVNL